MKGKGLVFLLLILRIFQQNEPRYSLVFFCFKIEKSLNNKSKTCHDIYHA